MLIRYIRYTLLISSSIRFQCIFAGITEVNLNHSCHDLGECIYGDVIYRVLVNLEGILSKAFAGVKKMLTGKKFPQNMRALRLVAEESLRPESLMEVLELNSKLNRTSKLWLDCFLKPVLIMMMFVRAEREGDWPLHIYAASQMIPYIGIILDMSLFIE